MFLVTFSIYNINRKTDEKEDSINHSKRYAFTKKYDTFLFTSALLAYILALTLASFQGIKAALVTAIPLLSGTLYSIIWIPKEFKYRRLKEIPVVKNLMVAIAWALTPTFLPIHFASNRTSVGTLITVYFFFISIYKHNRIRYAGYRG